MKTFDNGSAHAKKGEWIEVRPVTESNTQKVNRIIGHAERNEDYS